MNLAAKYTRTELLEDGEIQKWRGTNRATGGDIILYVYTGAIAGGQLPSQYSSASMEQKLGLSGHRLDEGVFGLSPCVVYEESAAFSTAKPGVFRAPSIPDSSDKNEIPKAFAPAAPPSAPVPAAPVATPIASAPEAPKTDGPGEFTSMFAALSSEAPAPAPEAAAAKAPEPVAPPTFAPSVPPVPAVEPVMPAPAAEPVAEEKSKPGAFTELYMAFDAEKAEELNAASAPVVEPVPEAAPEPPASPVRGTFTEMYLAVDANSFEPSVPEAAPATAPRGAFTEMYLAMDPNALSPVGSTIPKQPEPTTQPEAAAQPTPAEAPKTEETPARGTFTEMYLAVNPDALPAPAASPASVASTTPAAPATGSGEPVGEFTRMFLGPDAEAASPASEPNKIETNKAAATPAAPAFQPATDDTPGEFTQMFRADLSTAPATESAAPAKPVASAEAAAPTTPFDAPASPPVAPAAKNTDSEATVVLPAMSEGAAGEKYSSSSPAKGPIRFTPQPEAREGAAAPRSTPGEGLGEFTMMFASLPETGAYPGVAKESPAAPEPPAAQQPTAPKVDEPKAPPLEDLSVTQPLPTASAAGFGEAPTPPAGPLPPAAAAPVAPKFEMPAPSKPSTAGQPGEFTQFFKAGEIDAIRDEVSAKSPSAPAPVSSATPANPGSSPAAAGLPMPPASKPDASGLGSQAPGEFTMMFSAADLGVDTGAAKPPAGSAPASPFGAASGGVGTPSDINKPSEAGEFTQMFRAAESPSSGSDPFATPPSSKPGPAFSPAPFPSDSSDPSSFPPLSGSGSGGSGTGSSDAGPSFTQYFRAADADAGFGSPSSPGYGNEAPSPYAAPLSGSGSLSSDAPLSSSAPIPDPSPKSDVPSYGSGGGSDFGGGGATQFFQMPAGVAPQAPMEPAAPVGPGEYTRMISGAEVQAALESSGAGAPGGSPAAPAAGGGPSFGVPMPGVSAPSVSGPYVQGPSVSSSGVSGPYAHGPSMSQPSVHAPHIPTPSMSGPSMRGPSMSGPSMSGPSVSGSGVSGPSFAGPHASAPSMSGPNVNAPGIGSQNIGMPAAGMGAPQAPATGGSSASKLIIFVTIIVTIIAVSLVLMVAYFALKT